MFRRETLIALWARFALHRKPPRTSTMIALRARRQALSIARDIAYPHVEVPPVEPAIPLDDPARAPAHPVWYDFRPLFVENDLGGPAPRWMTFLAIGCILVIIAAAYVILQR
jgi:hypothetical protein